MENAQDDAGSKPMGDAQHRDLPDAIHAPKDRAVVARFDRLDGTLSSRRALRPSRAVIIRNSQKRDNRGSFWDVDAAIRFRLVPQFL